MSAPAAGDGWQVRLVKPRRGLTTQPVRPADIGVALAEVMLARENLLEDAHYQKIVPNQFVVDVPPGDYSSNYQPIEAQLCQQWADRLLSELTTANSRQGRRGYRFAGQVSVRLHPAAEVAPGHARIRSRLQADGPGERPPGPLPACLELQPAGRLWRLREGLLTIGRDAGCDLFLDMPPVQALRLVSSQHAYLRCAPGDYRLFDGNPQGQPSVNGTFVNGRPVDPNGHVLRDGDGVILAALKRQAPSLETPGVVGLRFRASCD